jgi:hypothetical protein
LRPREIEFSGCVLVLKPSGIALDASTGAAR